MRRLGLNTDEDGCCRCLKANYYKMGWANFTREVLGARDGFIATAMRVLRAINTDVDGCCKTLYARVGRLSWENYLGRLEHGGWDSQMTCILEYEEDSDVDEPAE